MKSQKTQTVILLGIIAIFISCIAQNKPTTSQQETINKAKANFVFVKGGDFMMGLETYEVAPPVHKVILDGFSISKYETTFKEYDLYTTLNSLDSIKPQWRNAKNLGQNYAVKHVNWQQSKDYCLWLGKQLNLPIDLPTEAQWEYAARSRGLDVEHATNNGKIEGGKYEVDNYGTRTPVGTYPPNPLGVHDMSGGRPEWTLDWVGRYVINDSINPVVDSVQIFEKRRVRGYHTLRNSVYLRGSDEPSRSGAGVGFRCVCNQKTPIN